MVFLMGFVPRKRFRRDKMERGLRRLVWRKHVWFHGQTAYDGAEIGTGLTQALLCLNSWGYEKGWLASLWT